MTVVMVIQLKEAFNFTLCACGNNRLKQRTVNSFMTWYVPIVLLAFLFKIPWSIKWEILCEMQVREQCPLVRFSNSEVAIELVAFFCAASLSIVKEIVLSPG
jgi:hypothetical protein